MRPHVWTNAFYALAGIYLATMGAYVAGAGLVILGICSWIGHDKGGKWWYLDWAGMYVSMTAIIGQNLDLPWVVLMWPLLIHATMRYRFDSVLLIAILFALALASAFSVGGGWVALMFFALGFVLRQQTHYGEPDYDFFHGSWHLFTAIGYIYLV
jgi:hypothetical protein